MAPPAAPLTARSALRQTTLMPNFVDLLAEIGEVIVRNASAGASAPRAAERRSIELLDALDGDHATPTLAWNEAYRSAVSSLVRRELQPLTKLLIAGAAHPSWLSWESGYETISERFEHDPKGKDLKVERALQTALLYWPVDCTAILACRLHCYTGL